MKGKSNTNKYLNSNIIFKSYTTSHFTCHNTFTVISFAFAI